ncbi:MAG TPA: class I SAM-dependent methyltransferase, partial [Bacteroidales bacterium]|nr:class I SAM-dependent methyltransferase [Bacteroidales bacterium]
MKKTFEYPDYFARFYDVIYHQLRSQVDYHYFLNKIMSVRGRILEIGVGTGRFFAEALRSGADIYGIDVSKSMIEILKNKLDASDHYRIHTGDACTMKLNQKFRLIVAPFRVFSH